MQMVLQRLLEHEQYHFNLHFADADTHEDSAGVSFRPRALATALCFLSRRSGGRGSSIGWDAKSGRSYGCGW
jgi:hypothetical protein